MMRVRPVAHHIGPAGIVAIEDTDAREHPSVAYLWEQRPTKLCRMVASDGRRVRYSGDRPDTGLVLCENCWQRVIRVNPEAEMFTQTRSPTAVHCFQCYRLIVKELRCPGLLAYGSVAGLRCAWQTEPSGLVFCLEHQELMAAWYLTHIEGADPAAARIIAALEGWDYPTSRSEQR